jgi:hypothetical protein
MVAHGRVDQADLSDEAGEQHDGSTSPAIYDGTIDYSLPTTSDLVSRRAGVLSYRSQSVRRSPGVYEPLVEPEAVSSWNTYGGTVGSPAASQMHARSSGANTAAVFDRNASDVPPLVCNSIGMDRRILRRDSDHGAAGVLFVSR